MNPLFFSWRSLIVNKTHILNHLYSEKLDSGNRKYTFFTISFFLAAAFSALFVSSADAAVIITFVDDAPGTVSPFDGGGVGAIQALVDGTTTFNLSTVDIIGSDGLSVVNNGATHVTNVLGSLDNLGINTSTVSGAESERFDVGEAWLFKFDTDLTFDSIDLNSFTAGQNLNLTFLDGTNGGLGTTFLLVSDPMAIGYAYAANTTVRFGLDGVGTTTDTGVRLVSFTVTAATAVPEPSAFALIGMGGLILLRRCRRSASSAAGIR